MGSSVPGAAPRSVFLPEIQRLRGLTMLGVVALHAFVGAARRDPWASMSPWTWIWSLNEVLFHDATTVFVLISGLLYVRVYAHLSPAAYWRRRLESLALPYLLMTAVFTPVRFGRPRGFGAVPGSVVEYPGAVLHNLVFGTAQYAYWFLPVALFTVAVAPAMGRLIRSRLAGLLVLLALLTPLVVPREGVALTPRTLLYFLGAFVVGAAWGANYETVSGWLRRFRVPLGVAVAVTSVALMALYVRPDAVTRSVTDLREHVFWAQKLAVAGLLALALAKVRSGPVDHLLGAVGEYSFAIYFLHEFVQHGILGVLAHVTGTAPGLGTSLAVGAITAVGSVVGCLVAVELLLGFAPGVAKAFLGAKRRYSNPLPPPEPGLRQILDPGQRDDLARAQLGGGDGHLPAGSTDGEQREIQR